MTIDSKVIEELRALERLARTKRRPHPAHFAAAILVRADALLSAAEENVRLRGFCEQWIGAEEEWQNQPKSVQEMVARLRATNQEQRSEDWWGGAQAGVDSEHPGDLDDAHRIFAASLDTNDPCDLSKPYTLPLSGEVMPAMTPEPPEVELSEFVADIADPAIVASELAWAREVARLRARLERAEGFARAFVAFYAGVPWGHSPEAAESFDEYVRDVSGYLEALIPNTPKGDGAD